MITYARTYGGRVDDLMYGIPRPGRRRPMPAYEPIDRMYCGVCGECLPASLFRLRNGVRVGRCFGCLSREAVERQEAANG